MKINKFKFKQILKLQLLNSRAYEYAAQKANSGLSADFSLTQTISDFKKALHIIFQYHKANKKVLFIGTPKKLETKINRLTPHIAVDQNFELQGVISNNWKSLKFEKIKKQSISKIDFKSLIPKLSKKPDLVVLLTHENPQTIISESNIAKAPVIIFESARSPLGTFPHNSYVVEGLGKNANLTSEKSLLILGLNFLFKRL